MRIKKNDKVQIIAGRDRGKTGIVKQMLIKENRCIVEGVNIVTKSVKPTREKEGSQVSKEMSIHLSNISLLDASGQISKVGFRFVNDKKERFFKKTDLKVDGQ